MSEELIVRDDRAATFLAAALRGGVELDDIDRHRELAEQAVALANTLEAVCRRTPLAPAPSPAAVRTAGEDTEEPRFAETIDLSAHFGGPK